MQKYATCSRYDINVTSCNEVPNTNFETPTTVCGDGYYYDLNVYGETTISEVNNSLIVCYENELAILDLFRQFSKANLHAASFELGSAICVCLIY